MDCGSNYVWLDDAADAEVEAEVSAPLFEQDVKMKTATTEDIPAPPPQPVEKPNTKAEMNFKKKVRIKNAGTNVISVNFQSLIDSAKVATGDPVFCTKCKAVFSNTSKIHHKGQNNNNTGLEVDNPKNEQPETSGIWSCEFCGTDNEVDFLPEEMPKEDIIDYILTSDGAQNKKEDKSKFTVFCIDISGSMGTSYEVKGKLKMKGQEKIDRLQSLNTEKTQWGAFADQYLPQEKRDITYVTRLQCIQAAISNQIETMAKTSPDQRVAICTFNREVQLFSSKTKQKTIAGDKLDNYENLFEEGKAFIVPETLKENKADLDTHLFSLEENGATALGPALTVSLGLVSDSPGSKIILCTDGLSNVGVGALDDLYTSELKEKASKFYENLGLYAKAKGVTISVLSIMGQDCSLENLGQLTEITSGEIDRVDPLKISKNFASIMAIPVVATNVAAILRLHKGLEINDVDSEDVKKDVMSEYGAYREIGNATAETVATFQYALKSCVKKEDFKTVETLPFQLQLQYTKLDGNRYMRVISKSQAITFDREKAEKEANVAVLGVHGIQQTAKLASKGDYTRARFQNWMHHDMMSRASANTEEKQKQFQAFSKLGQKFESEMTKVQQNELFSEGIDHDEEEERVVSKEVKEKKMKARKEKRGDTTSNMLYQMKAMNARKMMSEEDHDDDQE